MLFFEPPRTRYDLSFNIGDIPVRVSPLFWLISILFGLSLGSLTGIIIWVFVVFISILIHELGHSIAMRFYGVGSYIVLHAMGGLAIPTGGGWRNRSSLHSQQQIVISLAGPFAGFLFAILTLALVFALGGSISLGWLLWIIPIPSASLPFGGIILNTLISLILWVNVYWGLINLLPVYPLDGGQVSRHIFAQVDPWDGVRKSLWLSVITGAIVAIGGLFFWRNTYLAFLFGILAFQSYQMLRGQSGGRLF